MKKRIFSIALGAAFMIVGALSFNPSSAYADAEADSGKWVGVYAGGSEIHHCECTSSINPLDNECRVGDTATKISLCDD